MDRLSAWTLRRPRGAAALLLALAAGLGVGALRVGTDSGYRAFLGASHPVVRELDAVAARFGGGVPFALTFRCADAAPCRSVFDPPALALAYELATHLAAVPGVRRVDGPATSPLLVAERDDERQERESEVRLVDGGCGSGADDDRGDGGGEGARAGALDPLGKGGHGCGGLTQVLCEG
jgi:predicted RND superfamily exporter protein